MTPDAFARGFALLVEAYPRRFDPPGIVPPSTRRLYQQLLTDLDDAEWLLGVSVWLRRGGAFFPAPAELLAACRPPLSAATCHAAFQAVRRCTVPRRGGTRWDTTWAEPDIATRLSPAHAEAFLAAGGTEAFESAAEDPERWYWVERRFTEAYRAQQTRVEDVQVATRAFPEISGHPAVRALIDGVTRALPPVPAGATP